MTQHDVQCEAGGCTLSGGILSTPKQVFILRDVDHVECRRPLMALLAPVAAGFSAISIRFSDILDVNEMVCMIGLPLGGLIIAREIGTLKIHSLSLRGERIWGSYHQLKRIHDAMAVAMQVTKQPLHRNHPTTEVDS
ncbi:MAG: hypothetical protein CTY31_00015 [Hyphomicrobium sp.]|nr:MAG: hypothetical protein CTY39_01230 [Hyphomicrobium sp.]PPD01230.1 MAG: hypothetical protein CTY31_00015 [Hyphomicrobium sp.]